MHLNEILTHGCTQKGHIFPKSGLFFWKILINCKTNKSENITFSTILTVSIITPRWIFLSSNHSFNKLSVNMICLSFCLTKVQHALYRISCFLETGMQVPVTNLSVMTVLYWAWKTWKTWNNLEFKKGPWQIWKSLSFWSFFDQEHGKKIWWIFLFNTHNIV